MPYGAATPPSGSWSPFTKPKTRYPRPTPVYGGGRGRPSARRPSVRRPSAATGGGADAAIARLQAMGMPKLERPTEAEIHAANVDYVKKYGRGGRGGAGDTELTNLVGILAPHGKVDIPALRSELATPAQRKVEMPYYARELMDPAQRAMAEQNRLRLQQRGQERIAEGREPSLRGTIGGPGSPLLDFSPEQARIARGQTVPATSEQIQSQIGLMGAGQMAPRAAEETLAQQSLVRGQRAYEAAMARFTPEEVQDPTQVNRQGARVAELQTAEQEMQAAQERWAQAKANMQIPAGQQEQTRTDVSASMRPTDVPAGEVARGWSGPPTAGGMAMPTAQPPYAGAAPAMPSDIAAQQARFGLAPPIPQPGAMAGGAGAPPMPTAPPAPQAYWNPQFEAQLAELQRGQQIFTERPDLARMLQEQQLRYGEAALTQTTAIKEGQDAVNALAGLGTVPLEQIPSSVEAMMRPLSPDARTHVMTEAMSRNEDGTPRYPPAIQDAFSKYRPSPGATAQMDRGVGAGRGIPPTKEQIRSDAALIASDAFVGHEGAQFWDTGIKAFLEDPRLTTYIRDAATKARSAGVPLAEIAATVQDGIYNAVYAEILAKAPDVSMGGPPSPFPGSGAGREATAGRIAGDINLKIREKVYEEYRRLGQPVQ